MTIDHGRSASPSGHSRAEPEEVSALRASVPNAEWIDHSQGGGCPVQENTLVMVRFRDGMVSGVARASLWWMTKDQGRSLWIHRGRDNDIVAYWIANPAIRASAIEARRAATEDTGAVHESAVGAAETPNTSQGTSHG